MAIVIFNKNLNIYHIPIKLKKGDTKITEEQKKDDKEVHANIPDDVNKRVAETRRIYIGEEAVRCPLPKYDEGEILGIAEQLVGANRIKVICEDGKSRLCRIPGKLKKRMWIRVGDLVIIKPWEFKTDRGDVIFRYTRTQSQYLYKRQKIPKTLNIF